MVSSQRLPGSAISQLQPVVQEELLAYEIGAKSTLADGSLQLNAAVFYYDYTISKSLGALEDPIFGSLPCFGECAGISCRGV